MRKDSAEYNEAVENAKRQIEHVPEKQHRMVREMLRKIL
jgi:hypothetical protein